MPTTRSAERPRLIGDGPASCSTCTEVARQPGWVADVNGYYRDLGVPTSASRVQIKRAYLARGSGDARRTFVVKQLLDPVVRRRYDQVPLGSVFLDRYVLAQVRRAAALRATPGAGGSGTRRGVSDEVVLDTAAAGAQCDPRTADWSYAFYLWGTDRADRSRLAALQGRIVSLMGERKHHQQVAVGLRGGMAPPVEVTVVGNRVVVFLHEDAALTDSLVRRAVDSLTSPTHRTAPTSPTPPPTHSLNRDHLMAGQFRKGAEAAQEAGKGGAQFAKTHYLSLDADPNSPENTAIVRFLTDKDDWIVVDQHNNVPTKGKPSDYEGANWPDRMGAVCRKDVAFTGVYADCYICENLVDGKDVKKPTGRTWALACLREEVRGDGTPDMGGPEKKGKVLGIRDKTRQVAITGEDGKPTGEERTERAVVVVNMGYKNFFSALAGFAGYYGTVLDRDYFIKRNGKEKDTTYQIIPMDPIPHADGTVFDCRKPEHAAKYEVAEGMLEDVINDRASDEFYGRFFDRRVTASSKGSSSSASSQTTGSSAAAPEKDNDADSARLAALANRVKGYGGGTATEGATEAPPAGGGSTTAGEPATPPAAPTTEMRSFDD